MASLRNPVPRGRQAHRLAAAAVGIALFAAGEARAETTFTVTYKAPDVCPDRGSFIHSIQRHSRIMMPVGQAEQPDVVFAVELKVRGAKKDRVTGRLLITQGVKSSDRTVTGVTCNEVASALALIAALAIDPLADEVSAPEPLPVPPNPFGPPILGSEPQLLTGPAPVIVPYSLPPLPLRPGMMPPPWEADLESLPLPARPFAFGREGIDLGVGARFVMDVGPAPTVLSGVGVELEIRDLGATGRKRGPRPSWADPADRSTGPAWSLRAELSYTLTTQASTFGNVEAGFRMLRGRFIACVPGWAATSWMRLWPCASVGGGGEWAKLSENNLETEAAGPWLELGLSGRVDFVPLTWLAFELQAGPGFAVVKGEFRDGANVFEDPFPVSFGLGVGATASF